MSSMETLLKKMTRYVRARRVKSNFYFKILFALAHLQC